MAIDIGFARLSYLMYRGGWMKNPGRHSGIISLTRQRSIDTVDSPLSLLYRFARSFRKAIAFLYAIEFFAESLLASYARSIFSSRYPVR